MNKSTTFLKALCENLEGGAHSHAQKCVVVGTAANTSIGSYLPVHFKNEETFRAATGSARCGDKTLTEPAPGCQLAWISSRAERVAAEETA